MWCIDSDLQLMVLGLCSGYVGYHACYHVQIRVLHVLVKSIICSVALVPDGSLNWPLKGINVLCISLYALWVYKYLFDVCSVFCIYEMKSRKAIDSEIIIVNAILVAC